ncbi:FeoB-associated Cys-rich membrane protein [Lacticaseibacillus absianus]|uniref:FeoB-associated Cys-rich membrane protein n=1 Tax=Lacticaseibacillus absianus TaxID=2729623 RepID=UPI0015CBCCCB|nr:FeoB-associated Cys-rich membrane protein [Lacticaseibacillus absianus]
MATWIISGIIVVAVAVVVYNQFFNRAKKGAGCSKCSDVGCPLFDQAQRLQQNNKKHA